MKGAVKMTETQGNRELVLLLPFPPSVNKLYHNAPGKGRAKSRHYKEWLTLAGYNVKAMCGPLSGAVFPRGVEVALDLTLERKQGSRRIDIDNAAKAVCDLMTAMRVWHDDSQVADLHIGYGPVTGCRVAIRRLEDAA